MTETWTKSLNQIVISGSRGPMTCENGCTGSGAPKWRWKRAVCGLELTVDVVRFATKTALRPLGRRVQAFEEEMVEVDAHIAELVAQAAPHLLTVFGVGPHTAALLLIAAGDNPDRLRSEAAWAHLWGVSPIEASSGNVIRHRLNRGGDGQANHALWRIAMTGMSNDPRTRDYVARWTKDDQSRRSFASSSATSPARSIDSCLASSR